MNVRRIDVAAAVVALVLGVSACSGGDSDTADDSPTSPPATSPGASEGSIDLAHADLPVSWSGALSIARKRVDGKLASIELNAGRTTPYYEVKLFDGSAERELTIDARTRKIVKDESEKLDGDDVAEKNREVVDLKGVIGLDEALKTAMDQHAGQVREMKLEGTSRGPQYQFDIISSGSRDDTEVSVDARSGKVLPQDD